jgi:Uma2 family endonuclease
LSPDQRPAKVLKNINHCIAHGAQMGWLIDPEDRVVMVVDAGQRLEVIDDLAVILPVPGFAKNIQLTMTNIFGWLKKNNQILA